MKKMRILALLLLFTLIGQSKIVIVKSNGRQNGYRDFFETYNYNTHELTCKGSGLETCAWSINPILISNIKYAKTSTVETECCESLVNNRINARLLSSSYIDSNRIKNCWYAEDLKILL